MEDKNPNGMVKYCSNCKYFERVFTFPFFFSLSDSICKKVYYKSNHSLSEIHPKYNKPRYLEATIVRERDCHGNYWEPKGK